MNLHGINEVRVQQRKLSTDGGRDFYTLDIVLTDNKGVVLEISAFAPFCQQYDLAQDATISACAATRAAAE